VHLHGASALTAMDSDGGSDPYARLALLGQSHKSRTLKKTLNPLWEQTFEFSCVRGALRTETLRLAVFDWDQGSLDDLIGKAAWSKWASWRGHSWPPRAPLTAFDRSKARGCSTHSGGGSQSVHQTTAWSDDSSATRRPSRHFRCV